MFRLRYLRRPQWQKAQTSIDKLLVYGADSSDVAYAICSRQKRRHRNGSVRNQEQMKKMLMNALEEQRWQKSERRKRLTVEKLCAV